MFILHLNCASILYIKTFHTLGLVLSKTYNKDITTLGLLHLKKFSSLEHF